MKQLRPYRLTNTVAQVYAARRGLGWGIGQDINIAGSPWLTATSPDWTNPCDPMLGVLPASCYAAGYQGANLANAIAPSQAEVNTALASLSQITGSSTYPSTMNWLPIAGLAILVLVLLSGGHR